MGNKVASAAGLKVLFIAILIACLYPAISGGMALLAGMVFALLLGNPYSELTKKYTPKLLQASVVGLGAGMNLNVVWAVGAQGFGYTAVGIVITVLVGLALGKSLKCNPNTSLLVTVGTAICGGSAIAAVASTIKAKSSEVSVALATVFFLNATALFLFPPLGRGLGLTELQFGLFSALAIHDTSSVVGAAVQYGEKALEIATTVKLARALWIIPVSFCVGLLWNKNAAAAGSAKKPWFILWFLFAAALVTYVPSLKHEGEWVAMIARRALVVTLFLIGSGLSRETLKSVGIRPCVQGVFLWFLMGAGTLGAILTGWIH